MLPDSAETKIIPFLPSAYTIKLATQEWELRQAAALRRRVFCEEQVLFEHDDRDGLDAIAIPVVAVSWWHGMAEQVVGTVRIHHHGDGLWWGSRLAVARGYRSLASLGTGLISMAVGTANGHGCRQFLAHVQMANVRFFGQRHWAAQEIVSVRGRPHMLMAASLAHYPACIDRGLVAIRSRAA